MVAKIREAAKGMDTFRVPDLGEKLEVQDYRELQRIRDTIKDMLRRREIEAVTRGVYRYAATGDVGRQTRVFRKMCRAMHVKGNFTVNEIAMLTDGDVSYCRVTIKDLMAKGHLSETGHRKGSARMERCYRVVDRDRFYLGFVK